MLHFWSKIAQSRQPDTLDGPQLDKPGEVVNVNCGNRSGSAVCGRVVAVGPDFLGKSTVLPSRMVKRLSDNNGVFALRLVALARYRRHPEGLCLKLSPIFLLALRFKRGGVSARLIIGSWTEMGFRDAVWLALTRHS